MWVVLLLLLGWLYSAPPFPAKRWSSTCAVVVFGLGWTSFLSVPPPWEADWARPEWSSPL